MKSTAATPTDIPCFHCGLPSISRFSGEINGKKEPFCCPGCKAVANLIHDSGLENFYQHRDQLPLRQPLCQPLFANDEESNDPAINSHDLEIYDDPEYQLTFVEITENTETESATAKLHLAKIHIFGMNCSACAWLIEKRLEKAVGVSKAGINYSQHVLQVQWDNEQLHLSKIVAQIHALGFDCAPLRNTQENQRLEAENQLFLRRIGVAGIGMMQVGMYAMAGYFGASDGTLGILRFASLLIATAVIFYSARPFFGGAWRALRNKHLSMDVPVSIALGLAYGASLLATWQSPENTTNEVYFDAICMFSFFLLLSRYLEFKARSRWQNQDSQSEKSAKAHLISEFDQCKQVPSSTLKVGQKILIKTGEMFPVDALLLDRSATISQAQLNGEFTPVKKQQGDEISSGSILLSTPVEAEVFQTLTSSALARIRSLVESAQMHKPAISSLADKISGYFVFIVLMIAVGTYFFWFQLDQAATQSAYQGSYQNQAFWIALSVLVVSCPCALSLATPTALTVLMNHLRARGILVQNPKALEKIDAIDHIIFDKTGTLTRGQFQIQQVIDCSGEGMETQLLRAAALEMRSNHPLAQAFVRKQHTQNSINEREIKVTNWHTDANKGIEAELIQKADTEPLRTRIGNKAYLSEICDTRAVVHSLLKETDQEAITTLYLGQDNRLLAIFIIKDSIRPEAPRLIQNFFAKQLPDRSAISLFSGDHSVQVDHIGRQLGLSDVRKGMTAAEKLSAMETIQNSGKTVLAVGDGINDAPLLAAADLSIAVCNAIDLSKQTADFVLITDSLNAIDELFVNARKGRKVIKQNLSWALLYNLCALPLAMMGWVPPWLAALGMSASSAVVVLNAFRAKSTARKAHSKSGNDLEYQVNTIELI